MSFVHRKKPSGPSYFVCEPLEKAGFLNAFSTRVGGINFAKESFEESLGVFSPAIGAVGWDVRTARQIHSDVRLDADSGAPLDGDALITQKPKVLVGVRTADCLAVLIADAKTGVAAAVHAGWRGTKSRIVEKTVSDMRARFGAEPASMIAALGPAACGDCYEVGDDVAELFRAEFREADGFFRWSLRRKMTLDVAAVNRHQLALAGLDPVNIHSLDACTMHQNDLFYSHRSEASANKNVGRLLSVIGRG